jgi:hypothetical protein
MCKLKNSNKATAGIIAAILLIGLTIAVISMVQTLYKPQWLEQKEAEHMHIVSNQFGQLKYALDIHSAVEQKNAISTYITLGTDDIPIFGSGRTYDTLEILLDNCTIELANSTNLLSFLLGTIKYSSENSYFVDQSYIYEAGALILSQSTTSILKGKPFLSVSNSTNLSFTIINISGIDGKRFASGHGTYSLYTEFSNSSTYYINNLTSINIKTNYQNAWRIFFNNTNLKYSELTYVINTIDDGITVEFSNPLGNLMLKVIEISAQISPGWNEG